MSNIGNHTNRKKERKMAILATRKSSSYVLKKSCAKKIAKSKATVAQSAKIRDRARMFEINNLNRPDTK